MIAAHLILRRCLSGTSRTARSYCQIHHSALCLIFQAGTLWVSSMWHTPLRGSKGLSAFGCNAERRTTRQAALRLTSHGLWPGVSKYGVHGSLAPCAQRLVLPRGEPPKWSSGHVLLCMVRTAIFNSDCGEEPEHEIGARLWACFAYGPGLQKSIPSFVMPSGSKNMHGSNTVQNGEISRVCCVHTAPPPRTSGYCIDTRNSVKHSRMRNIAKRSLA